MARKRNTECRYIGMEPCRIGSSLISPGDIIAMVYPLDKNWEPVNTEAEKTKEVEEYNCTKKIITMDGIPPIPIKDIAKYFADNVSSANTYPLADVLMVYMSVCDGVVACRDSIPVVIEFGAGMGSATYTIGVALKTMGVKANFYTFEKDQGRVGYSQKAIDCSSAPTYHSELIRGDVRDFSNKDPICALVIDADHRFELTEWYIKNLWPRVIPGGMVFIHDIYRSSPGPETGLVMHYFSEYGFDLLCTSESIYIPDNCTEYIGGAFPFVNKKYDAIVLKKK